MLDNPKQVKEFSEFIGKLMNVRIKYNDEIKKDNTSYIIAGVELEEEKLVTNSPKKNIQICSYNG